MGFPNRKEINRAKKKLANVDPTQILPKDASKLEQLKYELCKQFVRYMNERELTGLEMAKELEIDPARVSEIIKYKIDLFTVDRLLTLLERLRPSVKVTVA